MANIFISYARADENLAEKVAELLLAGGNDVWRDDQLPAHRPYGAVIEERLASADAVLVLWSATGLRSQWVRAEADAALQRAILVQASLDGSMPPLPFNQIHYADLGGWTGSANHHGWTKIQRSIAELTAAAASNEAQRTTAAAPNDAQRTTRDCPSICVLPFQNMSGDAEQEYFSDGISEDITTDLSKVSALAVVARNAAFMFKGQAVDVCEAARKLGVSHVLEGSVRKAGSRVRITAQLIDGDSGNHVWAERYDRDLNDIFAIQDEISTAIVAALKLRLLPDEKKAIEQRGTTNPQAYSLYLMARQCWINDFGNRSRTRQVILICGRATEIDPDYAQAWALMAIAQAHLFYGIGANEGDNGLDAAERAIDLEAGIAEAHLPKAWALAEQGLLDESNAEIATAIRLDADSWEVNKEAARIYYRQRRIKDATRHLEHAVNIMETDFHGLGMLAACYTALGNPAGVQHCAQRIITQVDKVLAADADNGIALALGALSFAALGDMERARQWIDRALLADPRNLFMRYNLAYGFLIRFNDPDRAMEMLDPVFAKAGPSTIRLAANDPNLDRLRDDQRFVAMLAAARDRLGMA